MKIIILKKSDCFIPYSVFNKLIKSNEIKLKVRHLALSFQPKLLVHDLGGKPTQILVTAQKQLYLPKFWLTSFSLSDH